jgi:multiple sugar transport system permease protein
MPTVGIGNRARRLSVLITVVLGLVSLFVVAPYLLMLLTSFRSTTEILRHPQEILPREWTLSGYVKVFTKAPFLRWFRNSVVITASVTLAILFTSTITGFVFAKFRFRLKNALFLFILATMMVPSQVTMIPSFLIVSWMGLYNTLLSLIVPTLVSAFGIFLCRQFAEDIPDSLFESAHMDGAGSFTSYLRIALPQMRPAIGALAIFTFLESWNNYLGPLIMLEKTECMTLPLALEFFRMQHLTDTSAVMAAAALLMLPVTLVFIALQKQFVKGVSMTGMK